MRFGLLVLAGLAVPALGVSQPDLGGKGEFPQFRTLSGLPGGGFGIFPDGTPSFGGAMSLSTPIAYSLRGGRFAFGLGNTSSDGQLRWIREERGQPQTNGTGILMFGISGSMGDLTISDMILSRVGDKAINAHWTPPGQRGRVRVGLGVQDVLSDGGSSGEEIDLRDGGGLSTSLYGVATWDLGGSLYVSAGVGSMRFRTMFANASYNVHPRLKLVTEFDGFNWNVGAGADLARSRILGRDVQATGYLGAVRGRYATWSLVFSF
jgi:hypothetical protein